MTRIGFAYNQKPAPAVPSFGEDDGDVPRSEDEPPSRAREARSKRGERRKARGSGSVGEERPGVGSRVSGRRGESSARLGRGTTHSSHLITHHSQRTPRFSPPDAFAEWDSESTIAAVEGALSALGEVIRLEATADFPARLRAEHPDIVFNMAEGLRGVNRESHVPAICEFFGIPYTGSDPFTLSLCLDKARTKESLAFHGVPTARFAVVREVDELRKEKGIGSSGKALASEAVSPLSSLLSPPWFIKPLHEGSSKGITEKNFCRTRRELDARVGELLEQYAQPVLIEEYLPGAEFTCAVLGNGEAARMLPLVAMNFSALPSGALPVYGFEAKWLWDHPEHALEIFECPARIDEALGSRIETVVLRAYHVLGCRDWSRIDVRLDAAGVPNVVEVNPLPGILPDPADNSCFPKAARAAGMSYDELIQACVRCAAARQGVPLPASAVRAQSAYAPAPGFAPECSRPDDARANAGIAG